jgi:hypothetical protein
MRLSRRGALRLGGVAALGTALAAGSHAASQNFRPALESSPAARDVAVTGKPIPHFAPGGGLRTRFGRLDFAGGLQLSCRDEQFGGYSGLWIAPDGRRLLAVSDRGTWLSAGLVMEGGRPAGLSDAIIAPILGPDGRPLAGSRRFDTEGLCVSGGLAYLGVERVHEVLRLPLGRDGLAARAEIMPGPAGLKSLPGNRGLEALCIPTHGPLAGRLIGISERSDNGDDTPTRGFVLTGGFAEFTVARRDGFDITDAAVLPDGDILLLERRYVVLEGVSLRIRRIPAGMVRPGALLDGPLLIDAGMSTAIDNMEGLAVHRGAAGETVLTLISDDNFSMWQSTVLLQFTLAEGAA